MAILYITGLSGVGKTSVLKVFEKEGYGTIDTDYGYTKIFVDGQHNETILDEDKITQLIISQKDEHLILSGCYSNQGNLYKYFDYVVLLTARLDVMLNRVSMRTTNPYGKRIDDRHEILENHESVLPLLKMNADMIIDTTHKSIEEIYEQMSRLF